MIKSQYLFTQTEIQYHSISIDISLKIYYQNTMNLVIRLSDKKANILLSLFVTTSCLFLFAFGNINADQNRPKKKVAITLDDLPTLSHSGLLTKKEQSEYFRRILSTLENYDVKVIGFVNSGKLDVQGSQLLHEFHMAGHLIGNHTSRHPSLNILDCEKYIDDILAGEKGINKYLQGKKYFRYPMLHRGDTKAKKDCVRFFLDSSGYIISPVSIDTDDYMYNLSYVKAVKSDSASKAERIGEEYIKHIIEKSFFYDNLADQKTNRKIKHILLLHMNFINSHYLDDLIKWYQDNDWEIVPFEEAIADPVYREKDIYIGKWGISYLERIE